jgi:hypothetical protein
MGGLIARRYLECEGGHERTRKLITLGTPYRGAAAAVHQLVNGVPRGIGPLSIDLTNFARSLPSLYQLLPEYACIDDGGRGELLRTTEVALPGLTTAMVTDAMHFHDEINNAAAGRPNGHTQLHMILGARQATATTVRLADGRAEVLETYRDGRHTTNDFGDATVPRAGAVPHGLPLDTPSLHHVVDRHGNLQRNKHALDEVEEAITAMPVIRRAAPGVPARTRIPDLVLTDEPLTVEVDVETDRPLALQVTTTDENGRVIDRRTPRLRNGHARIVITNLAPGAYTIEITSRGRELAPITASVLVWHPNLGSHDL